MTVPIKTTQNSSNDSIKHNCSSNGKKRKNKIRRLKRRSCRVNSGNCKIRCWQRERQPSLRRRVVVTSKMMTRRAFKTHFTKKVRMEASWACHRLVRGAKWATDSANRLWYSAWGATQTVLRLAQNSTLQGETGGLERAMYHDVYINCPLQDEILLGP